VDVLALQGYKWLISPPGAGFMYVSRRMRKRLVPNIVGWRSHKDWRTVDRLHYGTPEFKDAAEKYEGGGLAFPLIYAMEASVNWILEIGPEAIEQRVLGLAGLLRQKLCAMGAEVAPPGSQIVTAKFPGEDAERLVRDLRAREVLISARHGRLRISPHFYNNPADVDRFVDALRLIL
jgi:selenocysteine lyase/cysteine desulfurase